MIGRWIAGLGGTVGRAFKSAALCVLLLGSTVCWAAPDISIVNFSLHSTKRISLTTYEYTYQVSAQNRGTAAKDVSASVSSARAYLTPVTTSVYFGRIDTGQTVISTTPFVIRVNRQFSFGTSDLIWDYFALDATFTGQFTNDPAASVESITVNYIDDSPINSAAIDASTTILRTDFRILLAQGTTVGQIQPLLNSLQARVIGTSAASRLMEIRLPDPGSIAAVNQVRAMLLASGFIVSANPVRIPAAAALPSNPKFQPTPLPNGNLQFPNGNVSNYLAHQLAIRGASAWNLAPRLDDANPYEFKNLPLLIIVDFFGAGAPTAAHRYNIQLNASSGDFRIINLPQARRPGIDFHGYDVLGIIASSFGGNDGPQQPDRLGPADDTSTGLATGLLPLLGRGIRVRAVDLIRYSTVAAADRAMEQIVRASATTARIVVNSSYVTNSQGECAGDSCPAPSATANCDAQKDAADWIQEVRNGSGGSIENRFLHVVAAGNNPKVKASLHSKYAAAGLSTVDPATACGLSTPTPVNALSNVLVVEGRYAADIAGEYTAGCPNGVVIANAGAGEFSPGGQISGIANVDRFSGAAGNTGIYAPYANSFGSSSGTYFSGSSFAAPQVAAVGLLAWAFQPDLSVQELKQILIRTAVQNQSNLTGGFVGSTLPVPDATCAGPGGYHPTVDAFNAILAADKSGGSLDVTLPSAGGARSRLALLDVAHVDPADRSVQPGGDNAFTQADIMLLLKEFETRHGARDYSRFDLNGDGTTGEAAGGVTTIVRRRFDLNGDGAIGFANIQIGNSIVPFPEDYSTDVAVLIYYAYSKLYTGNTYERDMLLLPYFASIVSGYGFGGMSIAVDFVDATNHSPTNIIMSRLPKATSVFQSLCASGERGKYSSIPISENISDYAYVRSPSFWTVTSQSGRLSTGTPNAQDCSSFIATNGSSGRVYISSAARVQDANGDREFQSRFMLGDPDPAAPQGTAPSTKRLESQALSYGVIETPTGLFRSLWNTNAFRVLNIQPFGAIVATPAPTVRTPSSGSMSR